MKRQGWRKPGRWKERLCAGLLAASLCLLPLSVRAETPARKTVFIGDSRTVGYYIAGTGAGACSSVSSTDRNGDFWCAKTGQGIDWCASRGVSAADPHVGAGTDAVFLIGVNDTYSLSGLPKTVELVNSRAAAWKERGARTFFASILPIRDSGSGFTNAKIDAWNQYLQENLSEDVYWIDLTTPTKGILQYVDTFHFQYTTYQMLYQYIKIVTQYTAAVEDGTQAEGEKP